MQDVTKDTFASEVREAEGPAVVDFWGTQCGPCLKLAPVAEQLARRLTEASEQQEVRS